MSESGSMVLGRDSVRAPYKLKSSSDNGLLHTVSESVERTDVNGTSYACGVLSYL